MATWNTVEKTGGGYLYNEPGYTYNQSADPNTGSPVFYNSVGTSTSWSNQSES